MFLDGIAESSLASAVQITSPPHLYGRPLRIPLPNAAGSPNIHIYVDGGHMNRTLFGFLAAAFLLAGCAGQPGDFIRLLDGNAADHWGWDDMAERMGGH